MKDFDRRYRGPRRRLEDVRDDVAKGLEPLERLVSDRFRRARRLILLVIAAVVVIGLVATVSAVRSNDAAKKADEAVDRAKPPIRLVCEPRPDGAFVCRRQR